jgi:hypothetical protein
MKADNVSHAIADVLKERHRQKSHERFSPEHDDRHTQGQLAGAAACYTLFSLPPSLPPGLQRMVDELIPRLFPWERTWWKPYSPRRDLVRAAALLIAEIERIDRRDGIALNPLEKISDEDLEIELARRGLTANLGKHDSPRIHVEAIREAMDFPGVCTAAQAHQEAFRRFDARANADAPEAPPPEALPSVPLDGLGEIPTGCICPKCGRVHHAD